MGCGVGVFRVKRALSNKPDNVWQRAVVCFKRLQFADVFYIFLLLILLLQLIMSADLSIVGESLRVGSNYAPRLTMRRLYRRKHLRDDQHYRHEVANHYRDYKLQQSSHNSQHTYSHPHHGHQRADGSGLVMPLAQTRRRRCMRLRPLQRPAAMRPTLYQLRSQLPIHVHYFPR